MRAAWLMLGAWAIAGCESLPPRTHTPWDGIVDRDWQVDSIDGTWVIPGSEIILNFGSDGVMTGRAQNRFHGAYTVDDYAITIEPVASTRVYLDEPEGAMEQEGRLFVALQNVETWEGKLVLKSEDGEIELSLSD